MYTFSELRKKAGFPTQTSLADSLNLKSRAVVARWETGENYPRTPLIPQIAEKLNCTERELIDAITASKAANKKSA